MVASGLWQVVASHDPQSSAERLEQNGHEIREQNHAKERITEGRAPGQVCRPVARVHVAHSYEIARPRKREHLAPEPKGPGNRHRAMNLSQTRCFGRKSPAFGCRGWFERLFT